MRTSLRAFSCYFSDRLLNFTFLRAYQVSSFLRFTLQTLEQAPQPMLAQTISTQLADHFELLERHYNNQSKGEGNGQMADRSLWRKLFEFSKQLGKLLRFCYVFWWECTEPYQFYSAMSTERERSNNKLHVRKPMMSKAGIVFQKQLSLGPSAPQRRPSIDDSSKPISFNPIKYQTRRHHGNFSPFRTVPRTSRDSYLLRVTKQPNVRTNYQVNAEPTLQSSPKYSLCKGQFERRISYDYETRDRSLEESPVPLQEVPKRCQKSIDMAEVKRPLTVSEFMDWRKTYHHFDFSKQTSYKNEAETALPEDYHNRTLDELKMARESNFNNMSRFSTKVQPNKAHPFDSDSPHKYLDLVKEKRLPGFDLEKTNWGRLRRMWQGNRANLDFSSFRDKVIVKQDRSEQPWNPKLEYSPKIDVLKQRVFKTVDFSKELDRQPNEYPNKYPMKLSQRMDYGMEYYPELRELASEKSKRSVNVL